MKVITKRSRQRQIHKSLDIENDNFECIRQVMKDVVPPLSVARMIALASIAGTWCAHDNASKN